jgi:hypothetical protein
MCNGVIKKSSIKGLLINIVSPELSYLFMFGSKTEKNKLNLRKAKLYFYACPSKCPQDDDDDDRRISIKLI